MLHGTADKTIPYAHGKKIYDGRESCRSSFVSLIGAPHVSFLQLGSLEKPPRWENVDVNSVVDFLDGELNHDAQALRRLAVVGRHQRRGQVPRTTEILGGPVQAELSTVVACWVRYSQGRERAQTLVQDVDIHQR